MQLWSWQGHGHSLLSGHVEWGESDYYRRDVPGAPAAYEGLSHLLGTDQILWCYLQQGVESGSDKIEWHLDIPRTGVLRFVDDFAWHSVLGEHCVTPELHNRWYGEALQRYPYDVDARTQFREERRKKYWDRQPSKGSWSDALFLDERREQECTAILRHPIPRCWVLRCQSSDGKQVPIC